MTIEDIQNELELISLENQADIVKAFGEIPKNKYLEIFTFTGMVGIEVISKLQDEMDRIALQVIIAKRVEEIAEESFQFFKKSHLRKSYLNARRQYYCRDIKSALYGNHSNFDYTGYQILRGDFSFGLPIQEFVDHPNVGKYSPNKDFDLLMKSITIKTYDLLNTYFSKNVTTI
jgi:hypothetical protein